MKLVRATEAQKAARDALTHAAWGERLSVAQFAEREQRLRGHPWARKTMTTWLWVSGEGADGGLGPSPAQGPDHGSGEEVLASCETFAMESLLQGRPGHSHAVASVFTEPALRGRGHAGAMMRALVARLPEEDPRSHATVLYSDVGLQFYEQAGYHGRVFPYRYLEAEAGDPAAPVDALVHDHEVEEALARAPLPEADYLVRPDAAQIDWHAERERAYAELLQVPPAPDRGARAGDGLVLWYLDRKLGRLEILLLLARTAEEAAALLTAARRRAHALGLETVRAWESPADPPWPEGLGRQVRRESSLPMIAPLVPGLRPEAWTWIPRALWV